MMRASETVNQCVFEAPVTHGLTLSGEVSDEAVDATDVVGHGLTVQLGDGRELIEDGGDGVWIASCAVGMCEGVPESLSITWTRAESGSHFHQLCTA